MMKSICELYVICGMYVESYTILVVVNRLSRPVVVLDGLPGLYGFKYDSATACGLPLYLYSYKLAGSATCVEKVVVDTCTQEVAKENEQLKQEVARLTKDLTQVKCKAKQTQLHQDNTVKGVKKLDEGQTVVCYMCHKEGHKSYECKVKNGGGAKKKEKKQTKQALQHLHQQGEQASQQ